MFNHESTFAILLRNPTARHVDTRLRTLRRGRRMLKNDEIRMSNDEARMLPTKHTNKRENSRERKPFALIRVICRCKPEARIALPLV